MAYLEEGTFVAYLAFSIFFLVAYKLDQISFVAFVVSLVVTALVHAAFYLLVLKYWPIF
ncbi:MULTISPECIES: hypothetical protein [Brevibacillus]|jgi:hypothetical protein|uniref:Uncharacterized protein n=1 Tax=Brevibacillus parabrevis TaxID=54914 RepID=A0A4Y3PTB8_BREPA|nr:MULTISPECIES: hypothetical protein [Brevibacillus]MBU8714277.1 hypothetical protein [Brevibacillus parabrevis]MDH6350259.1 putative membrane protein [Brevibacillus sp. 1238]MDR5001921.1 hypothetical protein [Brevibacillus parabrevis]MED2253340.1 hypothetical protein [Brevibacillus parabrevis]UED67943.1 hypothetical protein HP435_22150 [Brevibacillus sp. HD3.3A]